MTNARGTPEDKPRPCRLLGKLVEEGQASATMVRTAKRG
jgi:hypothetical protein